MKIALLACCVAVCALATAAANSRCYPTYECQYTYMDPATSSKYVYDFSSLCSETDYVLRDSKRHVYYANICGTAAQNCLPATWTNTLEFGVAVQTWGPTPRCNHTAPACADLHTNEPACCTANCQVLGTGVPQYNLTDPSNPQTGGVQVTFEGATPAHDDPFWCQFNPVTGAQYKRQVTYKFHCDPSVTGVEVVGASQNRTNDCVYTLEFKTSRACGQPEQALRRL